MRGELRIYLGAAPGVGKTDAMVGEARRRLGRATGADGEHLASLDDVVQPITGVRQRETVPDEFVRRAEQIELIDLTPEALRRRLAHGDVCAATVVSLPVVATAARPDVPGTRR